MTGFQSLRLIIFDQITRSIQKSKLPTSSYRTCSTRSHIVNLRDKQNNQGRKMGSKRLLVDGEYEVTPMRSVPISIPYPDYGYHGRPSTAPLEIVIYNEKQIEKIRKSARLARKMLDYANSLIQPGITTDEIDALTHEEIIKHGAYPSPINFHGFPKSICTSVNEVVCHGVPNKRPLEEGDIISIDVSLYLDGYHGDNCGTVIVGQGDDSIRMLIKTTQLALDRAISVCKPGRSLCEVGKTIEKTAHEYGFEVVHDFCGHGTGPILHMQPLIYHFDNDEHIELKPGMVFTIEPILVEGSRMISIWEDNWTAVTVDKGRAAQLEHEVLITSTGVEVLTIPE